MSDEKLERLRAAPPAARETAKRAALTAALEAFVVAEAKKDLHATQGTVAPPRHRNASPRNKGGQPMRFLPKFNPALAASLAATLLVAPTAWFYLHRQAPTFVLMTPLQESASRLAMDVPAKEVPSLQFPSRPAPSPRIKASA